MGRKEISALSHFDGDEIMLVRTEHNRPECDLKDFQKMLGRNPTSQLFRPPNLTFLIKCEAGVNIPPRLIERCYPVERLPLLGFGVWGLQGPAHRRVVVISRRAFEQGRQACTATLEGIPGVDSLITV
jgi:hypothetical protein